MMEKKQYPMYALPKYEEVNPALERYSKVASLYRGSWAGLYYLIISFFLLNVYHLVHVTNENVQDLDNVTGPANGTLGFGAIYAVSRSNSPRRPQLERAADLTGLDIKIPAQPKWTEQDVENVQAFENSTLSRGSALAWLGHLNALKRLINSPYETALIVEDDIDFDTHIRTQQIPATAHAIRKLLQSPQGTKHYYGDPSQWDIIWLGHCGDAFDVLRASKLGGIKVWTDTTMPLLEQLQPATRMFLEGLGVHQNQQRIVHQSVNPLCTFAYAVTKRMAHKLVNEYAIREPSRPIDRPCQAYDVRLLEACRDDGFKCISVTPELFHHTLAPSEILAVSNNEELSSNDINEYGDTPNIRCSARSELWWNSRKKPFNSPKISARGATLSRLAQQPDSCYLDNLRRQ